MAPARTARTTSVAGSHAAQELPLVRTGWALGKPRGQKDVGLLVGESGRAVDAHEVAQVGCHKAGLLGKLASGGRAGLLAGLQAAGGNPASRGRARSGTGGPGRPSSRTATTPTPPWWRAMKRGGAGAVCGLDLKALAAKTGVCASVWAPMTFSASAGSGRRASSRLRGPQGNPWRLLVGGKLAGCVVNGKAVGRVEDLDLLVKGTVRAPHVHDDALGRSSEPS